MINGNESEFKLSGSGRSEQLIGLILLVSIADIVRAGPIFPMPEPGLTGLLALCGAALLIGRSIQTRRDHIDR